MGGGVRNALFQKMAKKQQDDALSILEHLCADDVQVCGRWFTDGQRGFQDVKQINGYAKCILSRINEESPLFLEIEPCDLGGRHKGVHELIQGLGLVGGGRVVEGTPGLFLEE